MILQQPLLPLDIWRQHLGFDPWHFWGWTNNSDNLRITSSCNPICSEYEWQAVDAAGRVQIAEALIEAEELLAQYLNYDVAPKFREATLSWPRYYDRRMIRSGPYDVDGRWLNMQLPHGMIQTIGSESLVLIQANVPVSYTDADNDGLKELATIGPIATTVVDTDQIALYVSAADRFGEDTDVGDPWRITPHTTVISGGQVTVKANAAMFMRPILREGYGKNYPDPADSTNFLQTVDVYQRYANPLSTDVTLSQAEIIWETRPIHGWWCQCSGCSQQALTGSIQDPAAVSRAAGRVGIRDSRLGIVTPAETVYNTTDGTFAATLWDICDEPDRVIIRYYAGVPLERGRMSRKWQQVITRLAAAELNRPIVGCEDANRALFYWQQDLSRTGASREFFQTSAKVTDNRFGTRRGHVYAWNEAMDQRLTVGSLLL